MVGGPAISDLGARLQYVTGLQKHHITLQLQKAAVYIMHAARP